MVKYRNRSIEKVFGTLLSSLVFSNVVVCAKNNEASNEKILENNRNRSNFQRLFLTVGGKRVEVGTKGNSENVIVALHAYGNIPPLDIEIPKGKTEIPSEYIQLIKNNKNVNSDFINDFEELSDELSKKYKVIVINRPGYGNSDDTEEDRTGKKIAEEIHSVINQLNLKNPILLAHSMGGLFALSYIQKYPNSVSGYIGLDACTPFMFLEEERCGGKFDKHDPKVINWGSVAMVNECNEQLDNAKKLKYFKFPAKLPIVLFLSTFSLRYMEGLQSKGKYISKLREMNERLFSSTENQKIIEIEGHHFLYHKNIENLSKKIENISDKIFGNFEVSKNQVMGDINFVIKKNGKESSFHYFELILKKIKNGKTIENNIIDDQIKLKFQAEFLYNKLKNIMKEFYKNSMLQMEDECKKIMSSKSAAPNFLNEHDFEEKSKDNLILYRGMENSNISNDFFNGKVYFSTNTNNIRGTGIYTTNSRECAEYYSDKSQFTLAKMFISKENSKILESDRLQEIKNIMKENHPDEFSRFDGKNRNEFINDGGVSSYLCDRFNEEVKLVKEINENSMREISERMKNDPEIKKILSTSKKFFEDPESFCWYNDGFLTFLLGYDVLHTYEYLRDFHNSKEDEYLIVNPKVLNILKK